MIIKNTLESILSIENEENSIDESLSAPFDETTSDRYSDDMMVDAIDDTISSESLTMLVASQMEFYNNRSNEGLFSFENIVKVLQDIAYAIIKALNKIWEAIVNFVKGIIVHIQSHNVDKKIIAIEGNVYELEKLDGVKVLPNVEDFIVLFENLQLIMINNKENIIERPDNRGFWKKVNELFKKDKSHQIKHERIDATTPSFISDFDDMMREKFQYETSLKKEIHTYKKISTIKNLEFFTKEGKDFLRISENKIKSLKSNVKILSDMQKSHEKNNKNEGENPFLLPLKDLAKFNIPASAFYDIEGITKHFGGQSTSQKNEDVMIDISLLIKSAYKFINKETQDLAIINKWFIKAYQYFIKIIDVMYISINPEGMKMNMQMSMYPYLKATDKIA